MPVAHGLDALGAPASPCTSTRGRANTTWQENVLEGTSPWVFTNSYSAGNNTSDNVIRRNWYTIEGAQSPPYMSRAGPKTSSTPTCTRRAREVDAGARRGRSFAATLRAAVA